MKIYAIYKNNKFIIGFPSRKEAEEYGKVFLGTENGWEYDIKEMFLVSSPLYSFTNPYNPLTTPHTIPCTQPIPATRIREDNIPDIWGKSGFTVDYTQTPKTND